MGLLGIVSKRLQVSRHVEMQVLLRRLHQFQDLLFSESLAVFRVVVQEIGRPSLNGNGRVAISKKQLSQLGIVMNRTTDHSTMKTCFKADEQKFFVEEALHQSAQRLRTAPGHHALTAPSHDPGWTSSERSELHEWKTHPLA